MLELWYEEVALVLEQLVISPDNYNNCHTCVQSSIELSILLVFDLLIMLILFTSGGEQWILE